MLRVMDLLAWVDDYAPFRYAESWDRCGLQVGDPHATVERVMVALEPSSSTLREAEETGCRCIVTHHPLIFKPLDAVRSDCYPGGLVYRAIRSNIHCIAAHTNLDAAVEGTNGRWTQLLALKDIGPLEADPSHVGEARYGGMGRIGNLPRPKKLEDLVREIREMLGGSEIRVVGDPKREVFKVGLCTGSGAGLMDAALRSGRDVYITGDIKYHEAQRAVEAGLALVDAGHFASERLMVEPLAEYIRQRAFGAGIRLDVLSAREEKDPFWLLRE